MADKARPLPHILMTRPRAASERFLAALAETGVALGRTVLSPAISIEPAGAPVDLAGFAGVIVTSAHAVSGTAAGPGVRAWCVGDATAEAAARAGLDAVSAGGDAGDLVRLVARERPPGPVLYLRGRHVSSDLVEKLGALGVEVAERVVYDQTECKASAEARVLLEGAGAVIVPLFSPRTARIVAGWTAGATASVTAVAMSDQVAARWKGKARIAARPTVEAMVVAVAGEIAETGNG